jgi:hypothetical protein
MPERCAKVRDKANGATFLHLWNEVLRRSGVLKSIAPPPGSFLAELFQKHGVNFGAGLTYSGDQVQRLHNNFMGYLKKANADFELAEHRKEIAYLKSELVRQEKYFMGEFDKARTEKEFAIADRDLHREAMQEVTRTVYASPLWRMSRPLRALIKFFDNGKRRR